MTTIQGYIYLQFDDIDGLGLDSVCDLKYPALNITTFRIQVLHRLQAIHKAKLLALGPFV